MNKEFDRLKDNYRRCIRKREQLTRSGSGSTKKLPTCDYFVELSFLRDVVSGRKTESNVEYEIIDPVKVSESSSLSLDNQSSDQVFEPKTSQKARKRRSDQIDDLLAISLANDLSNVSKTGSCETNNQQDEDTLFCLSLVSSFKGMKGKTKQMAKIKVLQVLFELEEDE